MKDFNCFQADKVCVPWNVMKTIPKEQRKSFRSTYIKSPSKIYRSCVAFGVNEAARLLEKKFVSSILISAEVEPKFLVKHIIDTCLLHNIPVLVIPNLKTLLKELMNLSSIVVSFKSTKLNYSTIVEKIEEIYLNYHSPKHHINSAYDFENVTALSESSSEQECSRPINLYLHRKTNERVFIPHLSHKREVVDADFKLKEEEFVSFAEDRPSQLAPTICKQTKVSYKSLLLKRITNNKNRDVKKIVQLKTKNK
ncbi:hypothetical protein RI129_010507 [Pyrocoelia pectoralis]|uniref:Ribosomal protein eL8/eL30/eS12/Gadd45 domain-containing protein n=1 Tax=Pyrocoelia pectoralis TaxID=417401 RepID=A0AAN7ZDD2_9COLE